MLKAQSDRITAPIDTQQTALVKGGINPAVSRQNDRGAVDAGRRLGYMTLMLTRTAEQRAALSQLLQEQQNPLSPNYRKWLTPEEFAERFGVSPNDLDKLRDWLKSQGFTVESTARGRSWIVFSGTAAQVENTFHTQIRRYQSNGKMHFANAAQPSIPAALESLVGGIRGLDDFYPEPPPHPKYNGSDGFHALAPDDFAVIYDVTPLLTAGINGTGVGIAVIGQSDFNLTDIATFRESLALPAQVPQQILVGPDPGFNDSELEADLDLEWSGAVARNAALTYVYSNDAFDAASYAIDNAVAPIVSFSFSLCDSGLSGPDATALRDLAQQANAEGITWIASSGDAGAAACDQGEFPATHGLTTAVPASVPEVTGVGGTEFLQGSQYWGATNSGSLGSALSYIPEIGWNDTAYYNKTLVASGGGASSLYAQPYWQLGPGVPNSQARNVPDVSLSASAAFTPYLVVIQGQNTYAGGTSVSAPAFAGIVALLNHYLLAGGVIQQPGLANINPFLYGLAQSTADVFHDIEAGTNIVPCQSGTPDCTDGSLGYIAGPGYDQVTGLGSVDVYRLANEWNPSQTYLKFSDQAT